MDAAAAVSVVAAVAAVVVVSHLLLCCVVGRESRETERDRETKMKANLATADGRTCQGHREQRGDMVVCWGEGSVYERAICYFLGERGKFIYYVQEGLH